MLKIGEKIRFNDDTLYETVEEVRDDFPDVPKETLAYYEKKMKQEDTLGFVESFDNVGGQGVIRVSSIMDEFVEL